MRFRIVLRTEYEDERSLGIHDDPRDAMEHLRLWWASNPVWESHWIQGFVSVAIESEEDY